MQQKTGEDLSVQTDKDLDTCDDSTSTLAAIAHLPLAQCRRRKGWEASTNQNLSEDRCPLPRTPLAKDARPRLQRSEQKPPMVSIGTKTSSSSSHATFYTSGPFYTSSCNPTNSGTLQAEATAGVQRSHTNREDSKARSWKRHASETEKRGCDKGDTASRIKRAIAAKCSVQNWRAGFKSCCVYLWNFKRPYHFTVGKSVADFSHIEGGELFCPDRDSSPTGMLSATPRFAVLADQGRGFPRIRPLYQTPRSGFNPRPGHSRIFASGNRVGRCRWSAGLIGDISFPPTLHSGAAPYSPLFALIGSQELDHIHSLIGCSRYWEWDSYIIGYFVLRKVPHWLGRLLTGRLPDAGWANYVGAILLACAATVRGPMRAKRVEYGAAPKRRERERNGIFREIPPNSGSVRRGSYMPESGSEPARNETRFTWHSVVLPLLEVGTVEIVLTCMKCCRQRACVHDEEDEHAKPNTRQRAQCLEEAPPLVERQPVQLVRRALQRPADAAHSSKASGTLIRSADSTRGGVGTPRPASMRSNIEYGKPRLTRRSHEAVQEFVLPPRDSVVCCSHWLDYSPPIKANPGSILCGVATGFSHVGIVPDDIVCRRVFSGSPVSAALAFQNEGRSEGPVLMVMRCGVSLSVMDGVVVAGLISHTRLQLKRTREQGDNPPPPQPTTPPSRTHTPPRVRQRDLLATQTSSRLLEFPIRLATTQECSGETGWCLSPPRRITRVGEDSRWPPKTLYILPQPSGRQFLKEAVWPSVRELCKYGRQLEIAGRRRVDFKSAHSIVGNLYTGRVRTTAARWTSPRVPTLHPSLSLPELSNSSRLLSLEMTDEGATRREWSSAGMQVRRKLIQPRKPADQRISSGTNPACQNSGVTRFALVEDGSLTAQSPRPHTPLEKDICLNFQQMVKTFPNSLKLTSDKLEISSSSMTILFPSSSSNKNKNKEEQLETKANKKSLLSLVKLVVTRRIETSMRFLWYTQHEITSRQFSALCLVVIAYLMRLAKSPLSLSHFSASNGGRSYSDGVVVRLLASHLGEPGSIPGGVAPGFSLVGLVPEDTAGQGVFSGISSFPALSFRRCFIL
ncbi:hypothetical protein PR048_003800, partial [Dryococelus australis]